MANNNTATISVKEYDIESISRAVPGQISHIGISFSFSKEREVNFGSFTNGNTISLGDSGLFNANYLYRYFKGLLKSSALHQRSFE